MPPVRVMSSRAEASVVRLMEVMSTEPILTEPAPVGSRMRIPEPLGAMVRLSSLKVPMVAAEPLPRLKAVAETPRVVEEVRVSKEEAVMTLPPARVRSPSWAMTKRVVPEADAEKIS